MTLELTRACDTRSNWMTNSRRPFFRVSSASEGWREREKKKVFMVTRRLLCIGIDNVQTQQARGVKTHQLGHFSQKVKSLKILDECFLGEMDFFCSFCVGVQSDWHFDLLKVGDCAFFVRKIRWAGPWNYSWKIYLHHLIV